MFAYFLFFLLYKIRAILYTDIYVFIYIQMVKKTANNPRDFTHAEPGQFPPFIFLLYIVSQSRVPKKPS